VGGKGPNIVLDDAAFAKNVAGGVAAMMLNSGQTCSAPSRMLVPSASMEEAIRVAREAAASVTVGDPSGNVTIGPVVSKTQFDKIQALIEKGISEGATLVAGGTGRPDGLKKGFYVKPTVFANVNNKMTIAREEIFGPVLTILGYDSLDQAIEIANDTEYGLASYVAAAAGGKARAVAKKNRSGGGGVDAGL